MSDRRNPNSRVHYHDVCDFRHDLTQPCPVRKVVLASKEVDRLRGELDYAVVQMSAAKLKLQQVRLDRSASSRDVSDAATSFRALEKRVGELIDALSDGHINVMLSIAEERSDSSGGL